MPTISIILSTHDRPTFLPEAIKSVSEQTFKDWELLIITDPPIDKGTKKIINNYVQKDPRIKYFENGVKLGFRKCLNQGLKKSGGKYVARIDDDDIWGPQKLEKQVKFLEKNPEYLLMGSGAIFVDRDGKELYRYLPPEKDEEIRQCILSRNPFIHSSVMFLIDAAMKFGGYDDTLPEDEDFDLWLKLGTIGKFYNLPEYLIKYRTPSLKNNIAEIRRSRTKVFISIIHSYRNKYPHYKKALFKNYLKLFYTYIPKPKFLEEYLYKKRQTSGRRA
ncbi:MAG TPA: glycosyltransferase [Candidatus Humimicrobiaceae bacterium]|nr:glycosyltransferase [Candidatus Humimicrobiaceae bacterium]